VSASQASPLLVPVEELARHLGDREWIVVDCRFNLARPEAGEAAWRQGHIPGAWYAHLDRDLAAPPSPQTGRHPLPDPEALRALFSSWGLAPASRVVAYDDAGGAIAARLWWLLRWMGHAHASLLDGGWPAWTAAGLPVSTEAPEPRNGAFRGESGHMPMVSTAELERRVAGRDLVLFDARARPRFLGAEEPIDPVAGHIPGATNVPFQTSLAGDGRFRSGPELRARFEAAAPGTPPDQVIVMCGSGVTACHGLFAMELAGLPGARLYAGSWSEWIRAPHRPIARGEPAGPQQP
jgi:thiosulfate/3-mercaptopyruvate sulfurtransferase